MRGLELHDILLGHASGSKGFAPAGRGHDDAERGFHWDGVERCGQIGEQRSPGNLAQPGFAEKALHRRRWVDRPAARNGAHLHATSEPYQRRDGVPAGDLGDTFAGYRGA